MIDWREVFGATVLAMLIAGVGFVIGGDCGYRLMREEACANIGKLLHTETQYRDSDCQIKNGDGWVWLSDKVKERTE